MGMTAARQTEIAKYERLYRDFPRYRMSTGRRVRVFHDYIANAEETTWLDVGCGRGETRRMAQSQGIEWTGVDAVPTCKHAQVVVLPTLPFEDDTFQLVTCLDVMEHIPEDDWAETVREIGRVAERRIVFCISNEEDKMGKEIGETLHITRLPYALTDICLRRWLKDWSKNSERRDKGCYWWEFVR